MKLSINGISIETERENMGAKVKSGIQTYLTDDEKKQGWSGATVYLIDCSPDHPHNLMQSRRHLIVLSKDSYTLSTREFLRTIFRNL